MNEPEPESAGAPPAERLHNATRQCHSRCDTSDRCFFVSVSRWGKCVLSGAQVGDCRSRLSLPVDKNHQYATWRKVAASCEPPRQAVVTEDWLGWECTRDANVPRGRAINALSGQASAHDAAFAAFSPWRGALREGELIDFLGVRVPTRRYCNPSYMGQPEAHAIRCLQCGVMQLLAQLSRRQSAPLVVQTRWPVVAEEYLEYADVLASVDEYAREAAAAGVRPSRPYALVELGSGYGHWALAAHAALRQRAPAAAGAARFLLVDTMESLAPVVREVAELNGAGASPPQMAFHAGFVVGSGGTLSASQAKLGRYWNARFDTVWGTAASASSAPALRAASLAELLRAYAVPCPIDLLDADVQAAEYDLLSNQTVRLLSRWARRVHVGTHSNGPPYAEAVRAGQHPAYPHVLNAEVAARFEAAGWTVRAHLGPPGRYAATPRGRLFLGDGILSLVNPSTALCSDGDAAAS